MSFLKEGQKEWEVKEVNNKVYIWKKIYYLMKQTSQPLEYNQQVSDKHMDNAKDTIQKFAKSKKGRKAKKELKEPLYEAPRKSKY